MSGERVQVTIRKDLVEKARKFIEEQGGFDSLEEFLDFVLETVLEEEGPGSEMSEEDEEKVKERLRALGYM